MSIFLTSETPVIVQGITGTGGRAHTRSMLAYGTRVVAGVSPGHSGEEVAGVPVFDSCFDAVARTGARMSICFAGGRYVLDAVYEAVEAGISTLVCIEEFVPLLDAMRAKRFCVANGCRLIGPNCNGIISPGEAKVGFFPDELSMRGPVGIASRSGTLTYGSMLALQRIGIGQSTVVGVGGARIKGTSFVDCLHAFATDPATSLVVIIGEIGGTDEEDAAALIAQGYPKPVVALVAGRVAPAGVAMGHAGAIAAAGRGTWAAKVDRLRAAGAHVARTLDDLAATVDELLEVERSPGG